jgi:3-oxoacyl-[acyl-carrier protein] reductase
MQLQNKVAIVTGGASGFGAGIAYKFVSEGARVIIADIDLLKALHLAASLGSAATALHADVSKAEDIAQLSVHPWLENGLDILVNNAGLGQTPQPLDVLEDEMFDKLYQVNMLPIYRMARAFVPRMKTARKGAIVNIASTAGVSPRPNLCWYNASKGWVITATRAMAVELAPFGIRVNAVSPVAGDTPMLSTFMGEDTPAMRAKFLSSIPLGRFSTPEDIANATCFLASDSASMITGIAMEVDGGRCI